MGALGLAIIHALYITGGYPIPADSALCDGIMYAWDKFDFSDSVEMFIEGAELGPVGGATVVLGVGEGEISQIAGGM